MNILRSFSKVKIYKQMLVAWVEIAYFYCPRPAMLIVDLNVLKENLDIELFERLGNVVRDVRDISCKLYVYTGSCDPFSV